MPRLRPESSSETSSIVSGPLPVQSNGGVGSFSSHGALFHCTQPQALRLSDEQVVEQIDVIQDELSFYGYRPVTRALQAQGYDIHHKRVARIMRQQSLGIQPKRRFVRTTDTQHTLAALSTAVLQRRPAPGICVHHRERGSQYANADDRRALDEYGLIASMAVAYPYDHVQAERFMKTLQVEEVYA